MGFSSQKTKRLFIALPLPPEVREPVGKIQKELKKIEGGFKLVNLDQLHLTLKFLGNVTEEKIKKLCWFLEKINWGRKFKIKIKGLSAFPSENYVRVIWLGLENKEKLFELHKKINASLSKLFSAEKVFSPHLTLSRVRFIKKKEELSNFLKKFKEVSLGEIEVNKVVLYESILKKEGPVYFKLKEIRLKE